MLTFYSTLQDYWLKPFYCTVSYHNEWESLPPAQLPLDHTGLLPHTLHMNL